MTKTVLGVLLPLLLCAGTATAQDPAARRAPRNWEIAADGSVTVRGRVVFTDLKHDKHEKAHGSAKALLWYPDRDGGASAADGEIAIDDGAWSVTFRKPMVGGDLPPGYVTLSSCRIGDVTAVVDTEKVNLTDDAEFVFRVRAVPPLRLRVVDAETKKELDGVVVCSQPQWPPSGKLHPGNVASLQRVAEPGRSPLAVEAPEQVEPGREDKLWVRAPEHAWQPVEVLFAEGGTREVALPAAGTVKVALAGTLPAGASKLAVRLYRAGEIGASPAEFGVTGASVAPIESLAVGSYVVRLEVGEWFRNPRVLARADVTVERGGTAEVQLEAKGDVAAPAKVDVRGIVAIPAGWKAEQNDVLVDLEPVGATQRWVESRMLTGRELRRGDRDGEYRFAFHGVVAGRYVISVKPFNHQAAVKVAENGNEELRIEVPEPVEVVLRCVDAEKKPCNDVGIEWNEAQGLWASGISIHSASPAAGSNEIRIRVPVGLIQVMAFGGDYELAQRTLKVSPEAREFELTMHAALGVKVVLYEGDTKIPTGWNTEWNLSLHTLAGKEVRGGQRGGDTLIVAEPGTYLLRVRAPDSHRPVPDRQVKVGTTPFPTIEIKVARK
jgi:hypothetical protein